MFLKFRITIFFILINLIIGQFDWIDNGAPIRQGQHIEWQRSAGNGLDGEVIIAWSDTRDSMRAVSYTHLRAHET